MSLKVKLWPGRWSDLDQDAFSELLEYHPPKSIHELALDLQTYKSKICLKISEK